jgi:NAD-dependent dihydropyrimidine dehydrogenase PreA subunit
MGVANTTALRVLLHEGEGSREIPSERRYEIFSKLLAQGFAVTRTAGDGEVAPADDSDVLVLIDGGGADKNDTTNTSPPESRPAQGGSAEVQVYFRDVADADVDAVAETVESVRAEAGAYEPRQWKPWFPVIDYDRCTNCMQCLSFCLFDVYGVDSEGDILVSNEDKCKTNCPACSRVCPEVAILFPKYGQGPINGDVVQKEDVEREKMKVDISALLGGDIYSMLRTRHERAASRFSKERDEGKALKERQRCLKKLQGAMEGIPPEVLAALPSADEIQRKATEAAAKAKAALESRDERAREKARRNATEESDN